MQIKDIMSSVVISVGSDLDAELAWKEMRIARVHHLVVIDEGRIAGVISDRDLGGERGVATRATKRVTDLMTAHVLVASPEMSLRDAARLMRINTLHCMPVVDGKTLVGIVTSSDLLDVFGRELKGPSDEHQHALRPRGPNSQAHATANRSKNGATRA